MGVENKLKLIKFVSKVLTGEKPIKEGGWKTIKGRIRAYLIEKRITLLAKQNGYDSIRL